MKQEEKVFYLFSDEHAIHRKFLNKLLDHHNFFLRFLHSCKTRAKHRIIHAFWVGFETFAFAFYAEKNYMEFSLV